MRIKHKQQRELSILPMTRTKPTSFPNRWCLQTLRLIPNDLTTRLPPIGPFYFWAYFSVPVPHPEFRACPSSLIQWGQPGVVWGHYRPHWSKRSPPKSPGRFAQRKLNGHHEPHPPAHAFHLRTVWPVRPAVTPRAREYPARLSTV